ncbi:LOW QUALITY PROTEIN: protein misato homolog 1-like [Leptodactylus fuscus]|uniref:LOW QUALITY PROTEIN: protein misato homolog 1-like n=1 Tax=Leptodactylus fuscus TaxID=238119 RepID=UPI003F4EE553
MAGEVVTVQLGHYSNHVGAQWWSLQEAEFSQSQDSEVCGDVLFRRGEETYTPRLIAFEVKGRVGSVREDGSVYEDSAPAWRGDVSVHKEDPDPLQVEAGTPRDDGGSPERPPDTWGWSDFIQTQLHPKSLCVVKSHSHGGDGLESFSQGEAMFKMEVEEIEDRLHFFTEECDYLQGFQLLCDVHNGFSGAAVRVAELLHDQYPARGIFSFGTCPAPSAERDSCKAAYQLLNCVLALGPLSSHSSFFCPLSVSSSLGRRAGPPTVFPHLLYDAAAQYHSSTVLALALNTLTVPYRTSSSGLSMVDFAEALTFGGRKMLAASCSVPFPLASAMSLPDALLPHLSSTPWCSVSPCPSTTAVFSQSVVLRGVPEAQQISDLPAGMRPPSCLHTCESGVEVLQRYVGGLYPRTLSMAHLLRAPCTLGPSFPQFFSPYVTKDGFTAAEAQAELPVVGQVPVLAALQTSSTLQQMLRRVCDEVSAPDVRRWLNFATAAVEQDDFREAVDDVRSLAHCYRTWEGGESDDSD